MRKLSRRSGRIEDHLSMHSKVLGSISWHLTGSDVMSRRDEEVLRRGSAIVRRRELEGYMEERWRPDSVDVRPRTRKRKGNGQRMH